ncbi:MAG TPA: PH domain-containing protein [Bryobacteraceae bacterium]|nr:PH domain-containing protein [Bryobacteraceae bacterium]
MSLPPQKPTATPVSIHPSARLLKPFYWCAAILTGLILFYSNNTETNLYPVLIVPALIVLWTLAKHLRLRYTKLIVGGGKLRYETGMVSRSVRTMELAKVQDVRVDQSFTDRLLGLGTLSIETAGETSRLTMAGVAHPQDVADYILEAIRK